MRNLVMVSVVLLGCGSKAKQPVAAPHDEHAAMPMAHDAAGPPPLTLDDIAKGAALLPDLGEHHRAITTRVPEAQAYFDQGLRLIYGFNHDEAARSFAKAAQLDPTCASCFWGVALVVGPNYNVPMLPDRFAAAWDAVQKARANAPSATPVEQALIAALAKRYPGAEPKDPGAMQPYNQAYADAMADVATKFPADLDVQVLRAESLMDLNPWRLWSSDGKAAPGTDAIVATLESVLAKDPKHPGANHYYIHAIEASQHPEKAVPSAERLASLIPNAGHIVHMPAHIFQRVGRYAEAAETNRRAIQVDLGYIAKAPPWGYYAMYLVHNYGFLSYAASMEGRSQESIQAAKDSAAHFPAPMLEMMPGMDFFVAEPQLAMVRFGAWQDILAQKRPDAKYPTLTALYLHAHGLASAATGDLATAEKDLAEIEKLGTTIPADVAPGQNTAREIIGVSAAVLRAAIAQKRKDPKTDELWAAAVALEDKLSYSEPNDWFYPVRHFQGSSLIAGKKFKEAEAVYRADLVKNPNNGWALFGLAEALRGENKTADAAKVDAQFAKAWANADIKLTASAIF
jgi:tetratricopeptide (TPR) repeat protein